MGLFDGLRSKATPTFDPQKAVMTSVIASVMADGDVSEDEVGRLRSMCARSPIFASNTTEEDDKLFDFAVNVIPQMGTEAAVQQAANVLTPELGETAFAFAVEIVLADGLVGEKEESFIGGLATMLGISEDLARAIIEVTLIRARGL